MSITSPLISQTIFDNITLANSGHVVRLSGAGDARLEAASEELGELAQRMHSGGADGWFNVAMYQLLVAGALSHEWVIAEDLDGVVRSKFVPTQTIRFVASGENDGIFHPIQKANGRTIILNELTYHYRALITYENNPYAIPPLFAAIEPEWIMKDVRGSIRGIAHKLGLLGLFQILLEQPLQDVANNETDDKYHARLRLYLDDALKSLKKGFKDGVLVGFEGQHNFKHEKVTGDARGMSDIVDRVDLDANSGAKTDPALHGRNFSRTETQIRQVYKKMVRQLESMRRVITRSLEEGYALHLALAGFPEIEVSIDWGPIDSLDELHDQQVRTAEITNARSLYEDGIISQEERAAMLGFDTPDLPEPRAAAGAQATFGLTAEGRVFSFKWEAGQYKRADVKKKSRALVADDTTQQTGSDIYWPHPHEHEQHCSCGCGPSAASGVSESSFAVADDIEKLLNKYVDAVGAEIVNVESVTMKVVREYLRTSAIRSTPEAFASNLYQVMSDEYSLQMQSESMQEIIKLWSERIYRDSLLGTGFELTMGAIGGDFTPVFEPIKDTKTLNFLADTDHFYMGKYVKRGDTADRMKKKLIEEYIGVGKDFSDPKFINEVARTLKVEAWQAERIVRTTANMSRNFASLRMMEQSRVVQVFEIAGPDDKRKCAWCRSMLGRKFRVIKAVMRMRDIISAGPENVPNTAPMLTASIPLTERADGSKFIDLTDAEIQAQGFDAPSYHSSCRDRMIAFFG